MRRLTYKNARGESIIFYMKPFLIESLEGIGEVDTSIQTQNSPYSNGVSFVDSTLQERFIDMEGKILDTNKQGIREKRRYMSRVLNPRIGLGEITLELDGATYKIDAIPEGTPTFPERSIDVWQSFSVSWQCPSPFWRSPNRTQRPLVAYTGLFTLPMTFPFELGVSGSSTTVYNEGDVMSPVVIEIEGPTTNPQVINRTTGEFIKINRSISEGDKVVINTESGRRRIELVTSEGTKSIFGDLDHDSSLFYLELGENKIEHVADSGNEKAEVIVKWQNMYAGV